MRQVAGGKHGLRRGDELDAIVAAVLEAFEDAEGDGAGDEDDLATNSRHSRRPSPRRREAEPRGPRPAKPPPSLDEALANEMSMWPPEAPMPDEAASPHLDASLFGAEEAEFVDRAVDWLLPRPNADLILEHIWTLVVEQGAPRPAPERRDPKGPAVQDGSADDQAQGDGATELAERAGT